jgi:hypothetical protein
MTRNPLKLGMILIGVGIVTHSARAEKPAPANRSALSPAEFTRSLALIRPRPGEAKWMTIPWEIDVWQARKRAAAEGKPIFFLTGGGHSPLGDC